MRWIHFHRDGEQPVRVVVPHVLLQGEGKEFQIVQRLHVGRLDALFVETAAIEGNIGVNATAQVLKAIQLDFPNLFPWHRFLIYVENHTVLQTECVKSRHTRIAPFCPERSRVEKGDFTLSISGFRARKGQGFVAINPKMEYVSAMEQHNSTSTASQATPANTPAPKAQAARKFSTASASEKTAALVKWLEESKARDVVALDVAGKSPCMDVVIVVTASSLRHAKSLADGLMEQCTKNNYEFLRMEGYQTGQWILADLNDIVVHIFQQDVRELFRIESLWKESPALYGEMPAVSPVTQNPPGTKTKPPAPRKCIMSLTPTLLLILDGYGLAPAGPGNAAALRGRPTSIGSSPCRARRASTPPGARWGCPPDIWAIRKWSTSISGPDASCIRI